ncbi:g234 [Coccomyxa viridis]|uniref:G234 protein n=1 Tax=Coccomyxa viridis TaxID=1274662 RepID=A0ABP1FF83_9CHLO
MWGQMSSLSGCQRHSCPASLVTLQARPQTATASRCRAQPLVVRAAAATAPSDQKIRIKLKAYQPHLLQESVGLITEAARSTGAHAGGPVYLPTRRRIYCVLRSPHVNKDSREHFEKRTHSRLLDIKNLTAQTIDELMQLDLPAGVDVEVKL